MNKKILIIGSVFLVAVIVGLWAVPTFAADPVPSTAPPTRDAGKARILARLLLVQDEAKVDALIARAQTAGKITEEQAVKIKEFWTEHHQQFARRIVATRLLWANDVAKVQAFLDKAVASGKIQQEQADRIIAAWHALHD